MSEPVEVFPGNLSGDAIDRDAVLTSSSSDVRLEKDMISGHRVVLTFLQVSTVLRGVCEQRLVSAEAGLVP